MVFWVSHTVMLHKLIFNAIFWATLDDLTYVTQWMYGSHELRWSTNKIVRGSLLHYAPQSTHLMYAPVQGVSNLW